MILLLYSILGSHYQAEVSLSKLISLGCLENPFRFSASNFAACEK